VELEELADGGSLNWRDHILDLDQAMHRLAALDPEQARMVELRFFGGLNIEETAEVIGARRRAVTMFFWPRPSARGCWM
jgi:DNA-directed RNA polymerase specialized sigma24 family protein